MKRFKYSGERERRIVTAFFVGGLLAGGCSSSHVLGSLDGGMGGQAVGQGGSGQGLGGQGLGGQGLGGQGLGGQGLGGQGLGGQAGQSVPAPPFDAGYPGDVPSLGAPQSLTGYVESYTPPSGSDALTISFSFDPTGVVVGSVTFGTAAPPSPPTDPSVGYPPGLNVLGALDFPVDGFAYTMAGGSLVNSRLRFTIWTPELWSRWCALQTPVPNSDWCLPNWDSLPLTATGPCAQIDPSTDQTVSVDCGKLALCVGRAAAPMCACSAAGCVADLKLSAIEFDMALSADTANGSITGQLGVHNIRLTKAP